jgi:predicted small lipoprotein YifL
MLRLVSRLLPITASLSLAACGGSSDFVFPPAGTTNSPVDAGSSSTSPARDDAGSTVSTPSNTMDAGAPESTDASLTSSATDATVPDGAPGPLQPTADAGSLLSGLTSITSTCNVASTGTYATDRNADAGVDICKLNGAYFWTADLGIDCDGQKTAQCNSTTDPTFEAQTSIVQSNGQPLVASTLPFIVVPLPSSRFDYTKENIKLGALAAVVYNGQIVYGILGDEGPTGVIGDASYAMAQSLGMDPTPKTGGSAGPVTYIVFTGTQAVVSPVEDHTAAVTLATTLVPALIAAN